MRPGRGLRVLSCGTGVLASLAAVLLSPTSAEERVLSGQAALRDWTGDKPGVRRRITVEDLPQPYATRSVDNGPRLVPRPHGASPLAPPGFQVEAITSDLENPRVVVVAPNGDVFLTESAPGRVRVLRLDASAKVQKSSVFAEGLRKPFGIAFYPPGPEPDSVYIADTDAVVRIPYRSGDLVGRARPRKLAALPGGGLLRGGGHWTRDIAFSRDGKKMYVSVGSHSNVSDDAAEKNRADILEFDPDGSGMRIYASGIRNAVGITVHPQTGELWASVNERDELGDDLVPDYVTHVQDGGFYGWPWYYIGGHQDPRHSGARPELQAQVIVPDVLLQSHSASLIMKFYTGTRFPQEYRGDAFAAEHGSWNRARRTGYKIIRVLMKGGKATGEYEDFVTGFVTPSGDVWGRPVGVAVAADGSLLFTDDGGNTLWRVSYAGR